MIYFFILDLRATDCSDFFLFLISNLIALIVVWVCAIFVNMLWVCVYLINDNIYEFVFALLTYYGLMGIDFSVNMS